MARNPVPKLAPDRFGQQQKMSSNSDFLDFTHRLDTRPEPNIRDHPVPRVETKSVRASVFATKIADKARFRSDPADPNTVMGETHRGDAERQRCGMFAIGPFSRPSAGLGAYSFCPSQHVSWEDSNLQPAVDRTAALFNVRQALPTEREHRTPPLVKS